MDASRWRAIEDIYHEAVSRPPEARAEFLREVCRGDTDLEQRVQSLLAAGDEGKTFLEPRADEEITTAQAPPQQIGSYRILHRLGAGGMGEVFRGHDPKLGRDIAIKTLASEFARDPDRVARLRREARALAALNHPNLATIHDLVESNGSCYLVLELVEGATPRGPLPLDQALHYARQIADGLQAAHSRGIIHRDLKPANVIVTPEERVKVLDFGLAKDITRSGSQRADSVATLAGAMMGTPPYMSPEQVRGDAVDARTDIWAFGCLLYELLTGRRAFTGTTVPDIVAGILGRDPDWSALPSGTPAKIRLLLRQCLMKAADQRPADMQAAGDVIDGVIAARRGGRRQRMLVVAGAAVLVLAIAAIVFVAQRRASPAAGQHVRSILVIPFENGSRDPDAEYLSDGIAEGLIGSLATLPDVRVVARTTAFQFKGKPVDLQQIRKLVDVDAIVAGRLFSRANDIIVQADLIDAKSGTQLWGNRFREQGANVLDIEEAMVTRIAQALRGRLSTRSVAPTTNAEAYRLYLEGRFYWNKRTPAAIRKSHALFEQAIARDPNFALAYSGLADSSTMISSASADASHETFFARARDAARTAIRLNERLPEGHASLGLHYANAFLWAPAQREFGRALELNPNHTNAMLWYSYVLLARGELQESLDLVRKALEIDPLSSLLNANLALRLNALGKHEEALSYAQKATDLDGYRGGMVQAAMAYEGLRQPDKAAEAYERAAEFGEIPGHDVVLRIRADMLRGDVASARKRVPPLVERAERGEVLHAIVGWAYAGVGDRDEAMRWLNRSFEAREASFRNHCRGMFVKELAGDPRYQDLLRRLARGFEE